MNWLKEKWAALKSYVITTSLTFWAGVVAIFVGIAQLFINNPIIPLFSEVFNIISGGTGVASPANLIILGLGLIGIRRKLEENAE